MLTTADSTSGMSDTFSYDNVGQVKTESQAKEYRTMLPIIGLIVGGLAALGGQLTLIVIGFTTNPNIGWPAPPKPDPCGMTVLTALKGEGLSMPKKRHSPERIVVKRAGRRRDVGAAGTSPGSWRPELRRN
jgi:hypothetical protein